jgi:hypothetical protein
MSNMKRIVSVLVLVFCTLFAYSQNTFEKTYDKLDPASIRFALETTDNNYLFLITPSSIDFTNDYVLKVSSSGEIIGSYNYEIADGILKYLGIFKNPNNEDLFIIPALVCNNEDGMSTEIAILLLDDNMNFVDEKRCGFSDIVQDMSPVVIPSLIVFDNEIAMTAHVVLDTGGYANLYTRMGINGERLAIYIDDSYNKPYTWSSSIALIDESNKSFAVLNTKTEDFAQKLVVETIDSTMSVIKTQVVDYDNSGSTNSLSFKPIDTPVLKSINDSTLMLNLMATNFVINTHNTYDGSCLVEMNHNLEIIKTTFYFYNKRDVMVRLPLRNSFEKRDDYILSCDIINLHSYSPIYKTQCLVTKYDRDMNVIWERFVNQDEGYYYPHYVLATDDGGCLLAGYTCDEDYQNNYAYALKTDADGYLGMSEIGDVAIKPYFCYPNPANDYLHIELSPDVSCQSIEIYSIDGRLVETFHETSPQTTIDISGFNAGIYIMKIRMADGKEYSERIVKE